MTTAHPLKLETPLWVPVAMATAATGHTDTPRKVRICRARCPSLDIVARVRFFPPAHMVGPKSAGCKRHCVVP